MGIMERAARGSKKSGVKQYEAVRGSRIPECGILFVWARGWVRVEWSGGGFRGGTGGEDATEMVPGGLTLLRVEGDSSCLEVVG